MHANTSFSTIYRPVRDQAKAPVRVKPQSLSWDAQRVAAAGMTAGALFGGAVVASTSLNEGQSTLLPTLQWVATGVLGGASPISEEAAAVLGLFVHVVFSVALAIGYAALVTMIPVPRGSEVVAGMGYGALVAIVMAAIVLPLSHVEVDFFEANQVLLFIAAHMVLVGIPIALVLGSSDTR